MNWLKVGAVVVGGIVVFFVVDSLIHVFLGLLTAIVFVAIVGGGVYAAAKIHGARKRRELRQRPEYYEEQQARHHSRQAREDRTADSRATVVRPAPGSPAPGRPAPGRPAPGTTAPRHDVENDLARLKREMGS